MSRHLAAVILTGPSASASTGADMQSAVIFIVLSVVLCTIAVWVMVLRTARNPSRVHDARLAAFTSPTWTVLSRLVVIVGASAMALLLAMLAVALRTPFLWVAVLACTAMAFAVVYLWVRTRGRWEPVDDEAPEP